MEVGGCDLVDLARRHGTPLYVYDEATVRQRASEYVAAMGASGQVLYSAKAFASPKFLRVVAEEGLGLDVVSAGELHLALKSGFPRDRIHFLGNNKSIEDLRSAYAAGATIVIDGDHEFDLLREVVPEGKRSPVMLRLSPGVKPDTHDHISTGQRDSKFGFSIESGAARRELKVPQLVVEPGRSIAGPAGMALYTVGSIKDIPGVRRYVAVDGGMGDNIRPKLYGARYEAFLASGPERSPDGKVTIAGKYCESTDILITDIEMPALSSGDVIAVPAAGAYCLAMASNYNGMPRPEVLMLHDGKAEVMRRRETLDDLVAAEAF